MSISEKRPSLPEKQTVPSRTYESVPDDSLREFMTAFESRLSEREGTYFSPTEVANLTQLLPENLPHLHSSTAQTLSGYMRPNNVLPFYLGYEKYKRGSYMLDREGSRAFAACASVYLEQNPNRIQRANYNMLVSLTHEKLGDDPLREVIWLPDKSKDRLTILEKPPEPDFEQPPDLKDKDREKKKPPGPLSELTLEPEEVDMLRDWDVAAVQGAIARIPEQMVSLNELMSWSEIPYPLIKVARFSHAVAFDRLKSFIPHYPDISYREGRIALNTLQKTLEYFNEKTGNELTAASVYFILKKHVSDARKKQAEKSLKKA